MARRRQGYPPGGAAPEQKVKDDSELAVLRRGVYTVREVCDILRPSMTPRKVHYWLDQGMLGKAIRRGSIGTPTLLSFEQVLRIRTLQRIRDELKFTLREARKALDWILVNIVAEDWQGLRFIFRTPKKRVGVTDGTQHFEIPTRQLVIPETLEDLTKFLQETRETWEQGFLSIEGFEYVISDPTILGGSPVIAGTRVETAFLGNLLGEETLAEVHGLFPDVDEKAIREAATFENVEIAA